jgi:hypothetical protein
MRFHVPGGIIRRGQFEGDNTTEGFGIGFVYTEDAIWRCVFIMRIYAGLLEKEKRDSKFVYCPYQEDEIWEYSKICGSSIVC